MNKDMFDWGEARAARTSFYHPELDVLRFFAFLMVFVFHAFPTHESEYSKYLPLHLAQLFSVVSQSCIYGVDLFFALSAFLITEILLREFRAKNAIDTRAFYMRRILRIWPLYFTVLLCGPPIAHWIDPSQTLPWRYQLGFLLFCGNMVCSLGFPQSYFGILWSVSIEEQFYLAWPLIVKRLADKLPYICLILLGISSAAGVIMHFCRANSQVVWFNTLTHLDPIAFGALFAFILKGGSLRLWRFARFALFAMGAALFLVVGAQGGEITRFGLWSCPLIGLGCLCALAGSLSLVRNLGTYWNPIIHLGKISYGLYVFHFGALMAITSRCGHGVFRQLGGVVLAFLTTILIAEFSYRYLETPCLRLKAKFNRAEVVDSGEHRSQSTAAVVTSA